MPLNLAVLRCRAVGCDDVVGSSAREDQCGPSFLWKETPSTYEQLLTDFQKRKECNGKFFCLCEGLSVRPSLRTPRYAGTCCDSNSECQCCFTSSSVAKIPKTDECLAALQKGKCSSHVGNADKDGGTHFCIKDETQMASACCEEGYRFYPCPNPTQELTWNASFYIHLSCRC
uniref:Thyroglobulin type-1 domain-containing protein n=1 Tax=Globodera pallida TaxID=36090 RepID=A0A183CK37_GLOPA